MKDTSIDLVNYTTLVFDCDGVILNSNSLKSNAFYNVALRYGDQAASDLLNYHRKNGGISRYKKFEYFLSSIVKKISSEDEIAELSALYGDYVFDQLLSCEVASGLDGLRNATSNTPWMIISGGNQAELREIFKVRGLLDYFDAGIYGSPLDKLTLIRRQQSLGQLAMPALFIGDSRYDYEVAKMAGLDFIFVSAWSEFQGWQNYCASNGIKNIEYIDQLLSIL